MFDDDELRALNQTMLNNAFLGPRKPDMGDDVKDEKVRYIYTHGDHYDFGSGPGNATVRVVCATIVTVVVVICTTMIACNFISSFEKIPKGESQRTFERTEAGRVTGAVAWSAPSCGSPGIFVGQSGGSVDGR